VPPGADPPLAAPLHLTTYFTQITRTVSGPPVVRQLRIRPSGHKVWSLLDKAIHTGTLVTLTAMDTSNLWIHCYRFTRASFKAV